MRRQCECGNEVFEMVGSRSSAGITEAECCQRCGRPAASYAKPIPIVGSKHPPTQAEGWRELGPSEVIWNGDLFFGSEKNEAVPSVHRADSNWHVGHQVRGREHRYFRSTRLHIEDLSLAEWRAKNGGDASMDKHVLAEHPGQRVTTIYRADGSAFLSSGHRPDDRASWTAEQIVAAIGGEEP